jgi:excisionase family DNA binding protein
MNDPFYSTEEAAKLLDVTPEYVKHLLKTGKLNGQQLDANDWQISKIEVANFIKRQ